MPPPVLSVLDLAPIVEGGDAANALAHTLDLARHCETWGYRRYWLAEHHNMPGIASAATAVVIAHVAAGTQRIRVGSGGVMLPNHAPLVIAEQFGTLEALHPGRIDLGVGRAPGTDQATAAALRRGATEGADDFPRQLQELIGYLAPVQPGQRVQAVPGGGPAVPIFILGSSLFGARLAAQLGLPYAFASHFAPAQLEPAIELYRAQFRPSAQLSRPYLMLGVNVFAADTDAAAAYMSTSVKQAFLNLRRGRPSRLPPPQDGFERDLAPLDRALLDDVLACSFVGTPDSIVPGLRRFLLRTGADELIVVAQIFDHAARLRSYQLTAELRERLG